MASKSPTTATCSVFRVLVSLPKISEANEAILLLTLNAIDMHMAPYRAVGKQVAACLICWPDTL